MTQPSLRLPSNLQPRSKAIPTFSSTSLAATSTSIPPQRPRRSSQSSQSSPARWTAGLSDVSDRATASLIRRVLCPHSHGSTAEPRPIEELLPPLTSSNDVDLQLYAILAIIVKDLVYSWYGKITPDQSFVEEVVRIVAHCTRALESRLRIVDLCGLIFDEIPELLEGHIKAYRVSHQTSWLPRLHTDPVAIYHNLVPHPALSPVPDEAVPSSTTEQQEHEAEYRQLLVQGALAVLLPTEDLENACLRTLVTDVIADSILGHSVGGKVCEGWFLWGSIIKFADVVKARTELKSTGVEAQVDTRSRLETFGLVSEKAGDSTAGKHNQRTLLSSVIWRILQYSYLVFITIRFVILGFAKASSRPLRSSLTSKISSANESWPAEETPEVPRPILGFKVLPFISVLLNLPMRMPWLSGILALLQHHLMHGAFGVAATDGIIDQYLHYTIQDHFSPATTLPPLLRALRQTLFPNSALPPPAPPPPSGSEIASIRRNCAVSLLSLVPSAVLRRVFGTEEMEEWVREVEGELDVWGDGYLNKHLGYALLELVVVRVLPELGEMGPQALLMERLGNDAT